MIATLSILVLSQPTWASSDRRVAMVIGNGAYQSAPSLPNPARDAAAISANSLDELRTDEEHLLVHMGANGAIQARLETTETLLKDRSASIEALVSKESDADLAQTLVRLSEIQTAYQAALQSGGSILNRSLLDYIR